VKVVWLSPYPVSALQPELVFKRAVSTHPCSWIVALSNALRNLSDIDLHIITASSGISDDRLVVRNGIHFHVLRHTFPFTSRGYPSYLPLDTLTGYKKLRTRIGEVIEHVEPRIIHVHGTEYAYGLAGLDARLPAVISIQGLVTLYRAVEDSLFFRLQARLERDVIERGEYFGSRTRWADEFIKSINPQATIFFMPEAMDPLYFSVQARPAANRILFVGGVQPRKGIATMIQAMKRILDVVPTATLTVVGNGSPEYVAALKRFSKQIGVAGSVEWLGRKNPLEISKLHAESSVLAVPTLMDNSPNTVAEAMVSGLPVVASRVGGIPSMIEHGETGLLVEPEEPEQLAAAISTLLKNEKKRELLARNAQSIARGRHQPSVVAETTLSVYRQILEKEGRL